MRTIAEFEYDPDGLIAEEPGAKFDSDKPKAELLLDFSRALAAVSEVSTYGARKYSRGGWQYVTDGVNRYTGAMLRHLLAEQKEERGPEGLRHKAQVAWNALARLELYLREVEIE